MKIRLAKNTDLNAIAKLNATVFPQTPLKQSVTVFRKAFKNRIATACFVAEENSKLVGAVIAEKKISFTPNTSYITSFFVAKKHQRKGIGTALMKKCLAALKKKRINSVSLTVYTNNDKAKRLYEKNGFKLFRFVYLKKL
ncbi:MAG: GNAT family N-acetyltransferase [Candidatus Micrarchaeota archaeon]